MVIYCDEGNRICYAHHCVIDKLQTALTPTDRNPATRLLHALPNNLPFCNDLSNAVVDLDITPSRWSQAGLSVETIPALSPTGQLGLVLLYLAFFSRCKILSLSSDLPAAIHLRLLHVRNKFLLTINGSTVRTHLDVERCLAGLHAVEFGLKGITLLMGTPSANDHAPEDTTLLPLDGNIQQPVWSIASPSLPPLQCPSRFYVALKGPFQQEWL